MGKIKTLSLLAVVLAMSAVAASAASADEFTAEQYPLQITGSGEPGQVDQIILTSGTAACKKTTYAGTVSAPTTTVTVDATYGECTAFGFPSTVHMNGCQYLFHLNGGSSTEGKADLTCPAGKEVTVTSLSAVTIKCTLHFPAQSSIGTIQFTNIGAGPTRELTLTMNLTSIKYSHTKGTGLGSCVEGTAFNGTLAAKGLVTGENHLGTQHIGIFLSNV